LENEWNWIIYIEMLILKKKKKKKKKTYIIKDKLLKVKKFNKDIEWKFGIVSLSQINIYIINQIEDDTNQFFILKIKYFWIFKWY